MEVVDFIN
jgi:hypothetical protein